MPDTTVEVLRLGYAALDRQIYDSDDRPVGKVDDIELSWGEADPVPRVSAVLTDTAALGPRLSGQLGRAWAAFMRRMSTGPAEPVRIPIGSVVEFRPATRLSMRAPAHVWAAEDWLRAHVIGRIPGAGRADDPGQ
ncbi:hypothetical protein HNR12_003275 [Streptomonospora nanhaiensis]|uniref:PRC-barrel domain-containing protein n=1 Tax=Streptomonospora nanhaiensis TaxID=1323731 RepID=A0A853BNG1_9ACTN|nr:hypothetical protein [Streptomonospora nanhaiensis]NYI96998.1 hypothetical protein [Streptomonospora nanhaiensis]